MRRAIARVAVLALAAAGLVNAIPATAATYQVLIEDNLFTPKLLEVEPGDSVVWTAMRGGHTVTADDGRFDFAAGRTLNAGEQVSWTFATDEEVRYYCRIHGQPGGGGMSGLIRVGNPPPAPVPDSPTIVVPDDVPTIRAAAAGAQPGTQVLVRPGVYREEVVVTVRDLEIRGLGAAPDDVVVNGEDRRDIGITVAAPGVRIENLAVRSNRRAGLAVLEDVAGTVVANATFDANGLYGIEALAPAGIAVRGVRVRGHGIAGLSIRGCEACGARIDAASIEGNATGLVAVDATGLVVRGSNLRDNAAGIVLRNVSGAQVTGNTLTDNAATDVWVASVLDGAEPPNGAGILISGGRSILVASNAVTGQTYNVAVTGPAPVIGFRIENNALGRAAFADLAIDGVGTDVCFDGNRGLDGAVPTSDPPTIQTVNDCARRATVALPYPVVTANLANHAVTARYPI